MEMQLETISVSNKIQNVYLKIKLIFLLIKSGRKMKVLNRKKLILALIIVLVMLGGNLSCHGVKVSQDPEEWSVSGNIGFEKSKPVIELRNIRLATHALEILNEGNLGLVDKFCSSSFVGHHINLTKDIVGLEALKTHITLLRTNYLDSIIRFDDLFIKNNRIASRWTFTGTLSGPTEVAPPNNKKVEISGITILKVEKGIILEEWSVWNEASVLTQLGYSFILPTAVNKE